MIPAGVKVYGPGRIKAKAGQPLPAVLKSVKGIDDRIKKAGDKFESGKSKERKAIDKKAEELKESKKPKTFVAPAPSQIPLIKEKD